MRESGPFFSEFHIWRKKLDKAEFVCAGKPKQAVYACWTCFCNLFKSAARRRSAGIAIFGVVVVVATQGRNAGWHVVSNSCRSITVSVALAPLKLHLFENLAAEVGGSPCQPFAQRLRAESMML